MELRDYQKECLAAIPGSGAFLIQLATGLGKTVVFSQVPRKGRMLILSHRDELVRQPRKYFDCSFGIEQGKHRSYGEEVVSASVQSLVRRLNRFSPDAFDLLITDECHHSAASSYQKIYSHFKPRLHLGFTATPNRADGVGLESIYEDIIFQRDLAWGIKNGWLSDIYCLRVKIGYDLSQVAKRMGDYAPGELEKAVNIEGANKAIAEAYQHYAKGPTLIFAAGVAHAKAIAACIPGAEAVVGGEDRTDKINKFKNREIDCLVNCMVFTEGTDLPMVETVIIARPTQNVSLYTQMVGRGTRLYPGKERLTLIDCVGVSNDADLCTAPSLIGYDLASVPEKMQEEINGNLFDLPDLIQSKTDNPETWIKNVEYVSLWARKRKYNLHGVNWFRLADGSMVLSKPKCILPPVDSLGRIYVSGAFHPAQKVFDVIYDRLRTGFEDIRPIWDVKVAKRSWGDKSPTEKQMKLIKRKYPDLKVKGLTKLQASQILTRMFSHA